MLRSLRVQGLAVIEEARLELDAPFVVLSGETGAGKSLLVDALGLLCGGRGSASLVRTGASRLLVEGEFGGPFEPEILAILSGAGIELEEERIVLRREITAAGRGRGWINESLVGMGFLADVASRLVRIRGQNEAPDLADPASARDQLDRFAGLEAERRISFEAFERWRGLADRCRELAEGERERESRLDFAKFQLDELRQLSLRPGEEEELVEDRNRLAHAARIGEAASEASELLAEGEASASERLGKARKALAAVGSFAAEAAEMAVEAGELADRMTELARRATQLASAAEPDPERLEKVEERLERLRRLCRKHGVASSELSDRAAALESEIAGLAAASDELGKRIPERDRALADWIRIGEKLSAARKKGAPKLAKAIRGGLDELAMPGTTLEFRIGTAPRADSPVLREGAPVDFGPAGWDRVDLLVSPNPGEPPRPLGRIASGGELSRIQLALAAALLGTERGEPRTIVFDEVDSGVGGSAAVAIARKLRALSESDQILVVTHLASIAARAHLHVRVVKSAADDVTRATAEPLDGEARIEELARMLAGDGRGKEARAHAKALLAEARG
jgi:DNA repair protein RecN (Recombination protein N)